MLPQNVIVPYILGQSNKMKTIIIFFISQAVYYMVKAISINCGLAPLRRRGNMNLGPAEKIAYLLSLVHTLCMFISMYPLFILI